MHYNWCFNFRVFYLSQKEVEISNDFIVGKTTAKYVFQFFVLKKIYRTREIFSDALVPNKIEFI